MNGVILLNKPAGMTSFSAVRKAGRILGEKKCGHTGTLDPNAEGLLIVLLGKYTKLAPYCICDHKVYHASFRFGLKTDTQDIWGNVMEEKKPSLHSIDELNQAALQLTGDIEQIPPMYSAVHQDGKKLYELARKGIEVKREPRKVHVDYIHISESSDGDYVMDACVSSGTYIRTLIEDLGQLVQEDACMSALRRTAVENITLDEAQTFEQLQKTPSFIDPMRILSKDWPVYQASELEEAAVLNGKTIHLHASDPHVIVCRNGRILAAYELRSDGYFHCARGLF